MFDAAATALEKGLGLRREHQRVLIRTGWVLFVTGHVLWVCGFLAGIGLASPFARASDVDKLLKASEVSARINMQNELRVQVRLWCTTPDAEIRLLAQRRIDELRNDLYELAKVRTSEPTCEKPPT